MGTSKCCCYIVVGIILLWALSSWQQENNWGQPQEDEEWEWGSSPGWDDPWGQPDETNETEKSVPQMDISGQEPTQVFTPTPAGTTPVDGIYEILSPADIREWHLVLIVGTVVRVNVGYFSIGKAYLGMHVSSERIEFDLFCQNFTQSSSIGASKSWQFVVPATGPCDFYLSLIEPEDFTIAVYVKIETTGPISNIYTQSAGPAGTPLCQACVFTSDDGGTRTFDVILNHDTLYWFSAAALTPFDYRYPEQEQVRVWASLESLTTGTVHAVAAGGELDRDILDWGSTWFGISGNGTYRLTVTIVANGTYRRGIGLSIAQYCASGDSTPVPGETTPNPFLSIGNIIVLCVVVGGIVVVAGVIGKFSKRSVNGRAGTVGNG